MTRRLSRGAGFLSAVTEIEASYAALEADFLAFFPDLVAFCADWTGGRRLLDPAVGTSAL
jgi:acyl carrier protein phosphodiesterase